MRTWDPALWARPSVSFPSQTSWHQYPLTRFPRPFLQARAQCFLNTARDGRESQARGDVSTRAGPGPAQAGRLEIQGVNVPLSTLEPSQWEAAPGGREPRSQALRGSRQGARVCSGCPELTGATPHLKGFASPSTPAPSRLASFVSGEGAPKAREMWLSRLPKAHFLSVGLRAPAQGGRQDGVSELGTCVSTPRCCWADASSASLTQATHQHGCVRHIGTGKSGPGRSGDPPRARGGTNPVSKALLWPGRGPGLRQFGVSQVGGGVCAGIR